MKTLNNLKFMAMALFVAMLGLSLTACSDDDDDNGGGNGNTTTSSLIGKWENNEGYTINGHANTTLQLEFKSNGTGTLTAKYSDGTDSDTYNFEYSAKIDSDNDLALRIVWTSSHSLIYEGGRDYYPTVTSSRLVWGSFTYVKK